MEPATVAREDSSTIRSVSARLVRIPVDPPRGDAIQQFSTLELPLVEICDASGRTGRGFGYTIGTGGAAILALLRVELLPRLAGRDARGIGRIHADLVRAIHALTPGCIASVALAAIDTALWDLECRRTGTPLALALGGAQRQVPVYSTDAGWLDRSLEELVEVGEEAVHKHGFRALKLKVGKPDPHEDAARLARLREAVGPEVRIMTDANQAWTVAEAARRLKLLERYEPAWIEEPLPATDLAGHEELRQRTPIPLAGGESLYSPAYFFEYARRGALQVLQPDVIRLGGITPALQVCRMAQAANLPIAPHVSPELSVALAAAIPNGSFVEYLPQLEPVLRSGLRRRDGCALPSEEPGLGVDFDPAALDRFDATQSVP